MAQFARSPCTVSGCFVGGGRRTGAGAWDQPHGEGSAPGIRQAEGACGGDWASEEGREKGAFSDSAPASYVVGAFALLVAPFMEEMIFRGVLFAIFERRAGVGFAVVATALLFAGLHVPEYWRAWNHAILILVVGGVFSLARAKTGSLAPCVFLHLGYNASMVAGLFLQTQHFRTLQGMLAP
jgi:membrane protease YdiL (CAAX protease family)